MMPEGALNTVAKSAAQGQPWAILVLAVLTVAATIYMIDKVWWHARGKKEHSEGMGRCDPKVIDSLRKTTAIQEAMLTEVREFRKDTEVAHRDITADVRETRSNTAVLLDRTSRAG